jgi:hypothetical protein
MSSLSQVSIDTGNIAGGSRGGSVRKVCSNRDAKSRRDTILRGLASVAFALAGVFSVLNAPTWYLILGASIMLAAGALFVARAITSLRAGESTTSK